MATSAPTTTTRGGTVVQLQLKPFSVRVDRTNNTYYIMDAQTVNMPSPEAAADLLLGFSRSAFLLEFTLFAKSLQRKDAANKSNQIKQGFVQQSPPNAYRLVVSSSTSKQQISPSNVAARRKSKMSQKIVGKKRENAYSRPYKTKVRKLVS